MNSREQGSIWPLIAVGVVAVLLLIVPTVIRERRKSRRLATVEAQVQIADSNPSLASTTVPQYRWPDTEVPRTADRLRDATAVAIAATSYVAEGILQHRPPRSTNEILAALGERRLLPNHWIMQPSGLIMLPFGYIQLHYQATDLSLEVLSIPRDHRDGPAILIRLPDAENTGVGSRYFESLQLDGILYPKPFAPIAEVIRCGWQPRLYKQTAIPAAEQVQLETWARSEQQK
jgi:hypothetical protein